MERKIVTVRQHLNEHSSNVFRRATVAVGEVMELVPSAGGANQYWLRIDARCNDGSAWKTWHPSTDVRKEWHVKDGRVFVTPAMRLSPAKHISDSCNKAVK